MLGDEPFEGLFNIALKFTGFVMTDPPTVVAKECQTSACGIEISSASVLFGIPAAIWFLMAIVKRYSLTSFVIYRLLLGAGLLYLVHTGFFAGAGG